MHFIDYSGLRDRGIPGSKITIRRKERENRFPRRTRFSAKYYGWPDGVIDAY
jgi:predicted DNA-binding transcriptional regulator AlpA